MYHVGTAAHLRGENARAGNVPRDQNPYDPASEEFLRWQGGWDYADAICKAATQKAP